MPAKEGQPPSRPEEEGTDQVSKKDKARRWNDKHHGSSKAKQGNKESAAEHLSKVGLTKRVYRRRDSQAARTRRMRGG